MACVAVVKCKFAESAPNF